MAIHLTGLNCDDVAEVVECLLLGAEQATGHAPDLSARRQSLADRLGDALDLLPAPANTELENT